MRHLSMFGKGAVKTAVGIVLLGVGMPIAYAGFNRVVDGTEKMVAAFTNVITNK